MVNAHGNVSRAVVLAVGSGGDVAPLAAIAIRLAQQGLDTTLLAPRRYRHFVDGSAVAFQSIGADAVFDEVFDGAAVWAPATGLAASWTYFGAAMRTGLAIVREGWDPADTILVSSSFAVAARLAEELDGYRNTTVHLSPSVIFSAHRPARWPAMSIPAAWPLTLKRMLIAAAELCGTDPVIGKQVNALRAELGLPRVRRLFSQWLHAPGRVLYTFPEWFASAAPDWPGQGIAVGFPECQRGAAVLPPLLDAFLEDGRGTVMLITAGTAVASRPAWVERLTAFAVGQGARVIVVEPGSPPGTVAHGVCRVPFAPFDLLLPRTHIVAHHAGIGTMAEALRAGVPQLLVPNAHDQPDNAAHLVRLGAGRIIGADADTAQLAEAWNWALTDSALRRTLARLRTDATGAVDGALRAAHIILADAGRPVSARQPQQRGAAA